MNFLTKNKVFFTIFATIFICNQSNAFFKSEDCTLKNNANKEIFNKIRTSLQTKYRCLDENLVKLLRKTNNEINNLKDEDGNTLLLHVCINTGDTCMLDGTGPGFFYIGYAFMLIERGADVNAKNNNGEDALSLACKNGDFSLMHELILNDLSSKLEEQKLETETPKEKNMLKKEIKDQQTNNVADKNSWLGEFSPQCKIFV